MPSFSDISTITSFFSSQPSPEPSQQIQRMVNTVSFNPNDTGHATLLQNTTSKFQTKLDELRALDTRIILGFTAGAGTFTLSSLLPFGVTMAIATFGYTAYSIGKRDQLAIEYRVALSDAVTCLKWTLGKINNSDKNAVLNSPDVQALFDSLSPLMNEEQIRDAIDDAVEDGFVAQASSKGQDLFGRQLNKEEKALFYGIYGYEKGGFVDVGKGLWYLACKAVNWLIQSIKSLWSKPEGQVSSSRELPQTAQETELNDMSGSSLSTSR